MREYMKTFFPSRKGFLTIWLLAIICLAIGQFEPQSNMTPIGMGLLIIQACVSLFASILEEEKKDTNRNIEADKLFYKILLVLSVIFAVGILIKYVL